MNLLTGLSKFYQNEFKGLPHSRVELWDIGWELAKVLERFGLDEWKVHPEWPDGWEEDLINQLRNKSDPILIDSVVNLLHQSLLDHQREPQSRLFLMMGRDIVQYLLHREERYD